MKTISKYNVSKNKDDRTYDGIVFDSALEMRYYRDVVLPKVESGEIKNVERQKRYILQESFVRDGKKIYPITYVADFYIEYSNGAIEVLDIKGMPDAKATIKKKLFMYKYPDIDYKWIAYKKKYGGWGLYDDYKQLDREAKKAKAKALQEQEGEEENGN